MTRKKKSRRRWFQFSLRTILLLMVVAAIVATVYRPAPPTGRPLVDGWSIYEQTEKRIVPQLTWRGMPTESEIDQRNGRFVVRNADGRKRVDGVFKEGKPEGRWTIYHANGRIAWQGSASAGVHSGEWMAWHSNRNQAAVISFRQPDRRQAQSGDRVLKTPIASTEREGNATYWDSRGRVLAEGEYSADQREGEWKINGGSGESKRVTYRAGLIHDPRGGRFLGHRADWDKLLERLQTDLNSDDRQRQLAAMRMLRHCGKPGAIVLSRRLQTADRILSLWLLEELANIGTIAKAAEHDVAALSTSDDLQTSISALLTLFAISTDRQAALARLLETLWGSPEEARIKLIAQTGRLGEPAVALLERELEAAEQDRRRSAFQILVAMLHATQQSSNRLECRAAIVAALERIQAGSDPELAEAAKEILQVYLNWGPPSTNGRTHPTTMIPVVG